MRGHYYTISRALRDRVLPVRVPATIPWAVAVTDGVRLSGSLCVATGSDRLVVIVHGLGGSAESGYARRAAAAFAAAGWSSLRLNLRGADGQGGGVYHAGLIEDFAAVAADPVIAGHRSLVLLGYSLGGHVALRCALAAGPRWRAVAAVCAPLDLGASCGAIDNTRNFIYRREVLGSLKRVYRAVAQRRSVPTPSREVDRIRTIRQWDRQVVVPWFDFGTPEAYYAAMSVGPHLAALPGPALYVGSRLDPMVPYDVVAPSLRAGGRGLEVWMLDTGGHVGFPERFVIDARGGSLDDHLLAWFGRHTGG